MLRRMWQKEELSNLKSLYPLVSKEEICKSIPTRSWSSIKQKAIELKITRDINPRIKNKIENLLKETHETYYWMGFIAADGCFPNNARFSMCLSKNDNEHLIKFVNFIEGTAHLGKIKSYVYAKNIKVIPKIMDKFDLRCRKTYNPPKTLLWMDKDFLISFIIGFIDGDAHISMKYHNTIQIRLHSSWLNILKEISLILSSYFSINLSMPVMYKSGYPVLSISRFEVIRNLKKHAIKHKLPILTRKWDKVNENEISYYEKCHSRVVECYNLRKDGWSVKEIAKKVGLKEQRVYTILRKTKNKTYTFNNGFLPIILE